MPESKAPSRPDLVVPIYLDTNLLLDLLASIEGGFTLVEKLSTERGGTTDETKKIGGSSASRTS